MQVAKAVARKVQYDKHQDEDEENNSEQFHPPRYARRRVRVGPGTCFCHSYFPFIETIHPQTTVLRRASQ